MTFRRFLSQIAIFLLLNTCKTTDSHTKADYEDEAPTGDETWTQARIFNFNKYAADLLTSSGNEKSKYNELQLQLEESFKKINVKDPDPLSSFKLSLGAYEECFGEGSNDYGIWWNAHRDQIKKQIEEAAYFIRDFHYNMYGKSKGFLTFNEVVICPYDKVGSKMLLENSKLYIGIPYSFNNYQPIPNRSATYDSLMGLWQAGEPLGINSTNESWLESVKSYFTVKGKAKKGLEVFWQLFNPIAKTRVAMRKYLHENGDRTSSRLSRILSAAKKDPALAANFLNSEVLLTGSGASGIVDNKRIDAGELSRLTKMDASILQNLFRNWQCLIDKGNLRADLENAAVGSIKSNLATQNTDINRNVNAGIAVINHHRIHVDFSATDAMQKFYTVKRSESFKVRDNVSGWIVVDTSDDISVNVGIGVDFNKSLQTASLAEALKNSALNINLCE